MKKQRWLPKWKNKFKKMDNNFNKIIDSFKEKYVGTNWQWINKKGKINPGTVSAIVDVVQKGQIYFAVFDNDERVNVEYLKDFVVHSEDEPSDDNQFISNETIGAPNNKSEKPKDKKPVSASKRTATAPTPTVVEKSDANMFKMFESVKRDLNLKLNIELPEIKLLKMMFKNANDSVEFLEQLSKYVLKYINESEVQDALVKILDPGSKAPSQSVKVSTKTSTKTSSKANDKPSKKKSKDE